MPTFVEYQSAVRHLTPSQVRVLRDVFTAEVIPTDLPGTYGVTPGRVVGIAQSSDEDVLVAPRFGVQRALHLLGGALDVATIKPEPVALDTATGLVEAVAAVYTSLAEKGMRRGIPSDYHSEADRSPVVRGRIDMALQVSRSYGRAAPLHVTYDEFDENTVANRLLKAAAIQLRPWVRRDRDHLALARVLAMLESVSQTPFTRGQIPQVSYRPQDLHLRPAVELARLILKGSAPELRDSSPLRVAPAATLTFDMAWAFEAFIRNGLRRALGLNEQQWPSGDRLPTRQSLCEGGIVGLEPDISWWDGSHCVFLGDVKYKRANQHGVTDRNDITQVLAYAIAMGVDRALIVAGTGSGPRSTIASPRPLVINRLGTQIITAWLDLTVPSPADLDAQVAQLADLIRQLRESV